MAEELVSGMLAERLELIGRPCYMHLADGSKIELVTKRWSLESATGQSASQRSWVKMAKLRKHITEALGS